jgi:hypothetical protein
MAGILPYLITFLFGYFIATTSFTLSDFHSLLILENKTSFLSSLLVIILCFGVMMFWLQGMADTWVQQVRKQNTLIAF